MIGFNERYIARRAFADCLSYKWDVQVTATHDDGLVTFDFKHVRTAQTFHRHLTQLGYGDMVKLSLENLSRVVIKNASDRT